MDYRYSQTQVLLFGE